MQLTGHDIKELLGWVNPDAEAAPEQLDESITLVAREAFVSTDGEQMPAGIYVVLHEHQEDGLYGPLSDNNKRKQRIDREIEEVAAYLFDEMKMRLSHFSGVKWQSPDTAPDVELGGEKEFWIAVKSIRDGVEREHTFLANYLNKPKLLDDEGNVTDECVDWLLSNDDSNEVEAIGWHSSKEHAEYSNWYEPITFSENYALLGWAEYNAPPFFASEPVKPKTITEEPAYKSLVERYESNWTLAVTELFGMNVTPHHERIIESVQQIGSKTSVVCNDDETTSADIAALSGAMGLLFMLFNTGARVVVAFDLIRNSFPASWEHLKNNFNELCERQPWICQYFTITNDSVVESPQNLMGRFCCKAAAYIGNEESLAGEHAEHLFYIVDRADQLSDKAFGIITGSMTQKDNRILLTGNPTRNSGYFYYTQHRLAKRTPDDVHGYTVIKIGEGDGDE